MKNVILAAGAAVIVGATAIAWADQTPAQKSTEAPKATTTPSKPSTTVRSFSFVQSPETRKELEAKIRARLEAAGVKDEKVVKDLLEIMESASPRSRVYSITEPSKMPEEVRKTMEKMRERMREFQVTPMPPVKPGEAPRAYSFNGDGFRLYAPDGWRVAPPDMRRFEMSIDRLNKVVKSLSREQRELAKKKGFLELSDLTKEQREMLGVSGENVRVKIVP